MKRRDFLKGLSAIIPASLLAKFDPPKVFDHDDTYVTWAEETPPVQTQKETEFKNYGGYFASYYSEWMK